MGRLFADEGLLDRETGTWIWSKEMPYKRLRAWPGFGDHVGSAEGQAGGREGVGREPTVLAHLEGACDPESPGGNWFSHPRMGTSLRGLGVT